MASAQTRAIFLEGDITHVMRAIFNAPMSANQFEQTLGRGLLSCERRNEIDHLSSRLSSFADGDSAGELSDLCHTRPVLLEILVESSSDLERANFFASSLQVDGAGLFKRCQRISKVGDQMLLQSGLIAFDHQDGVPMQCLDTLEKGRMGMQGISRINPPSYRQEWKEGQNPQGPT